jgi:hypothetical protein
MVPYGQAGAIVEPWQVVLDAAHQAHPERFVRPARKPLGHTNAKRPAGAIHQLGSRECVRVAVESLDHLLKSNRKLLRADRPIEFNFFAALPTSCQKHTRATLAQLVERLIRNQQVASSILAGGSRTD